MTTRENIGTGDLFERIVQLLEAQNGQAAKELLDNSKVAPKKIVEILQKISRVLLDALVTPDLAHTHAHALALDRALALAFDRALALALDRANLATIERIVARKSPATRKSSAALAYSGALAVARDRALTLARALALAHDDKDNLASSLLYDLPVLRLMSRFILLTLSSMLGKDESQANQITLLNHPPLTIRVLAQDVVPFLDAVVELHRLVSEIQGELSPEPVITSLTHNSPMTVSFDLNIAETIKLIRDEIIPFRKAHEKQKAALEIAQKNAEIEKAKAEIEQIKNQGKQVVTDPAIFEAERRKANAEAAQAEVAVKRQDFELYKEQVTFALSIINQLAPNLPEQERIAYVDRFLRPIKGITNSSIEIARPDTLPEDLP